MSGVINDSIGTALTDYPGATADILNGDDADQDTFSPPLVNLAQKARWNNEEILTRGSRRLRFAASVAAAKALTDLRTNDTVRIDHLGVYVFNSSDGGESDLAPVRYTVTSGGILRAVAFGHQARNTANGSVGLDAAARVPSAQLRGHVVAVYDMRGYSATGGATVGTGSAIPVDVTASAPGSELTIPNLEAGDIIMVCGVLAVGILTANQYAIYHYMLHKTDNTLLGQLATVAYLANGSPPAAGPGLGMCGSRVVEAFMLTTPTATSLKVRVHQQATTGVQTAITTLSSAGGIYHIRKPT